MKQATFASLAWGGKKKTAKRELFLTEMNQVVPWAELCAVIAPYYPKGENGRPPKGLERMLRIYLTQQWYGLSDPDMSQTRKGNPWHFGMKIHTGTDVGSGLVHTVKVTTASVHDKKAMPDLLHGEERAVFGDKGYVSDEDKRAARANGIFWGVLDKG